MKHAVLLAVVMGMFASMSAANAKSLQLDAEYLQPSGAIMTFAGGQEIIDPYFPTKALLTASDTGMNINVPAMGWINWMLARQEPDGLFSVFCQDPDIRDYRPCIMADADDSMMAMWVELLYRMAPKEGMPASWRQSLRKAQAQLDGLYNRETGVYFISQLMPVGLLMDNIEIYASMKRSAQEAKRIGEKQQAALFSAKAAQLRVGIIKNFWDPEKKMFRASTQPRADYVFYPDIVAQLMPMLHGFDLNVAGPPNEFYSAWMRDHHKEWTDLIGKDYPWGLVAVVATQHDDMETASCWLQQAEPHRRTGPWNVLDEAAFQSVQWSVQKKWPGGIPACQKVDS
ncbi:MAG: hypothetical protein SFX19_08170 [Alphaproteobacteria bacterium]|nr:hypothetical protein [Alphaproteobacteria bacterium]